MTDRSDLAYAYEKNWVLICLGCGLLGGAVMTESPTAKKALGMTSLAALGLALLRTKAIEAEHHNRDFIDAVYRV